MQLIHEERPEIKSAIRRGLDEEGYEKVLDLMSQAACLAIQQESLSHEHMEISLTLVGREEIHTLNREYREVDRETDVLSFPQYEDVTAIEQALLAEMCPLPLGDVVLCYDVAAWQAEEYGHSLERELVYLFLHSVLHLLGYDHMTEEERQVMRDREKSVLAQIDL